MLHHRAEHNLSDATTQPVGAARQCQGETRSGLAVNANCGCKR